MPKKPTQPEKITLQEPGKNWGTIVKPEGGCRYTPYVYEANGRVSTCFYNTACGQEYVGIPFHGARCKNCDRNVVKAAT